MIWLEPLGKRFESVRFEIRDWQNESVREAIGEHNFKVEVRWLSGGGDPACSCWWHITDISLDHVRPSPEWIRRASNCHWRKSARPQFANGSRSWQNLT
ncbi:MAG TPA: hypothetical protein VNN22_14300 [Verrucomicrobiae bacterium]|nr:hypothetical protein [Verrucomicrobiae bacterium]